MLQFYKIHMTEDISVAIATFDCDCNPIWDSLLQNYDSNQIMNTDYFIQNCLT